MQQFLALLKRRPGTLRAGETGAERVLQLFQERWHAVIDFHRCRRRNRPPRHLRPAPADDLFAVKRFTFEGFEDASECG
jgi:hypothetical protein